ncbi:NrfD/PsrC family molybdoenzyme membrane anchor subunit [Streptomyces sp. QTS52]
MKVSSLAAVSLSGAALVHDLGVPSRFPNMLRVFKPNSPMSVGSWLLAGYGPVAGAASPTSVTGRLPRTGRAATAALLGPALASYTAVLAADAAVPAWHGAHHELPYVFVESATAAASGMALILGPTAESASARRAAALKAAEKRLGDGGGDPPRGPRRRPAAHPPGGGGEGCRSRQAAVAGGLALLAGSARTRFGIFAAGIASAEHPRHTVVPQQPDQPARP